MSVLILKVLYFIFKGLLIFWNVSLPKVMFQVPTHLMAPSLPFPRSHQPPWRSPLSAHLGAAPAAGRRKGRRPPLRRGDGWARRSDSGRAPATGDKRNCGLKSGKAEKDSDMTTCTTSSSFSAVAQPETRV